MSARKGLSQSRDTLPALRFEVFEVVQILRMSRAQLYNRIKEGSIKCQKDGMRTYVTRKELERYVTSCDGIERQSTNPIAERHGLSPVKRSETADQSSN